MNKRYVNIQICYLRFLNLIINHISHYSFSMDERSKRIRNKTKRYISTDEEKYQYKKKKKSNIYVQETFDYIRKALAAKYDEENFEKHSESEKGADTSDEDEQREILAIEKEQPSLSCQNQNILQNPTFPTNMEYSLTHNCTNMYENKKAEIQSFQNQRNNFYRDLINCNNNNEPLVPTIVSNSDSSLSQNSNSTILTLNSHTSETLSGTIKMYYIYIIYI